MFLKRDLLLTQEYFGFLLLNIFDLFLTGWIFKHSGQEANGLAAWVLAKYGLAGFAVFKFLLVAFLIVICEVIALRDIQRARLVVLGGCALYALVVIYECYLIFNYIDKPAIAPPPPDSSGPSAVITLGDATMAARYTFDSPLWRADSALWQT